jgi:RNA polymerase sigma-70 factor, ECF subfamily
MHTVTTTTPLLYPMTEPPTVAVVGVDFADLYRLEYPGLLAVATALSGADGEDLVHDAMLRALVNWPRVSRLERPGGWCHRVLVNRCRSWWRKRAREARILQLLRPPSAPPGGEPSADVVAFWSAVRELPERPRLAVVLHYAGERTTADIAEIIGVPEGTIRSDISRARQILIRQLAETAEV